MSNEQPQDPRQWKIFPRNLTANATYYVVGNPTVSRPEDGVDNSYPGLECDTRNLDKFFFPGLYVEFYRGSGAMPIEVIQGSLPYQAGLRQEDLTPNSKLNPVVFVWAIMGRTQAEESATEPPLKVMVGKQGLAVYRYAHGLLPGKIALLIGREQPSEKVLAEAIETLKVKFCQGESFICRRDRGSFSWAILVGERARYLDENGVIDPEVYQPGQLTQSLCAPWMYDFRDCSCFYWASNKPDVVTSEDGDYPYLNFLRKNWQVEPPTTDIAGTAQARRQRELDYGELVTDWEQLRAVVNDRESGESYVPSPGPTLVNPLKSKEDLINELNYLASVEHALAVEYLYAYYSLNTPENLAEDNNDWRTKTIWTAAQEILKIAVDEMRHLRWANECLTLLDADVSVGRAALLGRNFNEPFVLRQLTPQTLQWFIDVERPSRVTTRGLDGMYVRILDAIEQNPDWFTPEVAENLLRIVKLIIDEGEEHYVRFSNVQRNLGRLNDSYLRSAYGIGTNGEPFEAPPETPLVRLQQMSDHYYATILRLIQVSFALKDKASGKTIREAIKIMFSLNGVNFQLAEQGMTPLFTLPDEWPTPTKPEETCQFLEKIKEEAEKVHALALKVGDAIERAMARQNLDVELAVLRNIQALIEQ
ncbi:MAG: ferritin-like domain-containing protein [Pleurocapsa sp. MO_226.B13]|nr:ferritin-like domain-containing protein [Pleurocapsa sp. MO_226.B13]